MSPVPVVSDPALLYMALMLRKLHEARPFGRVLDAGIESRYRIVLREQLPGASWIGLAELWAPVLEEMRLRSRPDDRLGVEDLRFVAAARCHGLDLALLEDQFDGLEAEPLRALAALWLERASLILAVLPAAPSVNTMLPGLCARFVTGRTALCCFSADSVRVWPVVRLHGVLPAMVARMTGAA